MLAAMKLHRNKYTVAAAVIHGIVVSLCRRLDVSTKRKAILDSCVGVVLWQRWMHCSSRLWRADYKVWKRRNHLPHPAATKYHKLKCFRQMDAGNQQTKRAGKFWICALGFSSVGIALWSKVRHPAPT